MQPDAFAQHSLYDEAQLVLRLVAATLAGAAIGWNRHKAGKPAGIGTHALVALGSAVFVIEPASVMNREAVSRVIQGVATGIGFLGAGEIFKDPGIPGKIAGLTSAAAIWGTAAVGLLIASGSYIESATATLLVLLVLVISPRLERRFPPSDDVKKAAESGPDS